ncbi:Protein of unknown function [Gryllus bimaculatus]|nr:Protein of unknown function [Gryllus bimaculatus]
MSDAQANPIYDPFSELWERLGYHIQWHLNLLHPIGINWPHGRAVTTESKIFNNPDGISGGYRNGDSGGIPPNALTCSINPPPYLDRLLLPIHGNQVQSCSSTCRGAGALARTAEEEKKASAEAVGAAPAAAAAAAAAEAAKSQPRSAAACGRRDSASAKRTVA